MENDELLKQKLDLLLQAAEVAMQEDCRDKAFEFFMQAAELGSDEAQFSVGVCYERGVGVEQSFEMAAQWYEKAAEQGHIMAERNLGVLYINGQGVGQDVEKAKYWLKKASDQAMQRINDILGKKN